VTHPRLRAVVTTELATAKRSLTAAALATIGSTLAALLTPWPLKIVFDQVLLEKPLPSSQRFLQPILDGGPELALGVLAFAMITLALLRAGCLYLQLFLTTRVGYAVMRAIQRALFAHLQRLSLSFHARARSGELQSRVTSDAAGLRDVIGSYAVPAMGDTLTLLGMFIVMAVLDWRLALVPLLSFPILYLGLHRLYGQTKTATRRQRSGEGRMAARISEVLAAVSMVQAYGRERYEDDRLEAESERTMRESVRAARLEAANSRTVEAVSAVATAAVVVAGALRVRAGALTPGDLLVFTGYLSSMYRPVRSLAKASSKLSRASISAERIGELLELDPDVRDDPAGHEAHRLHGEISLDSVVFGYGDAQPVLDGLSLKIRAGSRVALVGPSGAGKSTVAALLMRLYDPTAGVVTIDGRDLRSYRLDSLRRQLALVPQASVLFGASVRENIAYGRSDATDADIVGAARAANAHDFIVALPDGYDTVLGERGASVSGGQARRLAIARAIVRDASILILDEPMTGLDAESETAVRDALDRVMARRTCVTITHDLQACAGADEVLMLDGGRIVARGSHRELLAGSISYRRLAARGPLGDGPGRREPEAPHQRAARADR
jgi:ATP-binding cassette subfamily B protein